MLNSLENFLRMVRRGQPQWLPMDLPTTPPIDDLIEQKTGTRCAPEAFDLDFRACDPFIKGDSGLWRTAFAAMGVRIPDDADVSDLGISWVQPTGGSPGRAGPPGPRRRQSRLRVDGMHRLRVLLVPAGHG